MLDFVTVDPNVARLFNEQTTESNHVLTAIKDVQQFYQDSFDSVITWTAIIFGAGILIVGVVVPFVIHWLQSRSFEKTEKQLQEEIAAAKATFSKEIDSQVANIKKELNQKVEELKQEAENNVTRVVSGSLLAHATNLSLTSSQTYLIILLALRAAYGFAKLKNDDRLNKAIKIAEMNRLNLRQHLIQIPLKERKNYKSGLLENCNVLLDILKEKKLDIEYIKRVLAIEKTIQDVPLETEATSTGSV